MEWQAVETKGLLHKAHADLKDDEAWIGFSRYPFERVPPKVSGTWEHRVSLLFSGLVRN